MLTRTKLLLAGLAAAAAMMLSLAAPASARSFSVNETGFEAPIRNSFELAGNNITCAMTQLAVFNAATFIKTQGLRSTIRHVTGPSASECTGGTMTVLNETLPWNVNYISFRGILPLMSAIRWSLIGMAYKVSISGLTCLFKTTSTNPAFVEWAINTESGANRGRVESYRYDERVGIPLGGGFSCELAGEVHISGTGTITNLPGLEVYRVTLI